MRHMQASGSILCNTCLVCHACFSARPHPCTEVVVNVADYVCQDRENNGLGKLATPPKPDNRLGFGRMQAKLVMAAQNGKLCDRTRAALSDCPDVLGVKVPNGSNGRQTRDLAMQHALPLLAQWDSFVPDTDRVTRSAVQQAAPNPAALNLWMASMDSSLKKMMVPTCVRVLVCCVLLLHLLFCGHVFQGVPIDFWWLFNFPILPAPGFFPSSPFGFQCCTRLFFGFCNYYVSRFPRWFLNHQWVFNCLKASISPLTFVFSIRVGGRGQIYGFRRHPPLPKKSLQASDPDPPASFRHT